MSSNARAQRRAMMEPIPSQINATARTEYMQSPGRRVGILTCGVEGVTGAIAAPTSIKGTSKATKQPIRMVMIPKISNPVERSL